MRTKYQEINDDYGKGLNCSRFIHLVWENGRYLLFKHDSHSVCGGWFKQAVNCESYYVLLDSLAANEHSARIIIASPSECGEIWRAERRWSKALKEELEKIVGAKIELKK